MNKRREENLKKSEQLANFWLILGCLALLWYAIYCWSNPDPTRFAIPVYNVDKGS